MVLLLVFGIPVSAYSQDISNDWNITDTVLQGITIASLELDREQTQWISRHPLITHETNIVMGKHPSPDVVTVYFISTDVIHTAVAYGLRKTGWNVYGVPLVTIWQSTVIGAEVGVTVRNYNLGIQTHF